MLFTAQESVRACPRACIFYLASAATVIQISSSHVAIEASLPNSMIVRLWRTANRGVKRSLLRRQHGAASTASGISEHVQAWPGQNKSCAHSSRLHHASLRPMHCRTSASLRSKPPPLLLTFQRGCNLPYPRAGFVAAAKVPDMMSAGNSITRCLVALLVFGYAHASVRLKLGPLSLVL